MADDKNKYKFMDPVLTKLSGQFIALPDHEVTICNEILKEVVNNVVSKLKRNNPLFEKMFFDVFYGGSFYDKLRVGQPDEFDLDLLLTLPKYAEPELLDSNMPGFLQLRLNNHDGWMRQPEALPGYRNLIKLLDDKHYLDAGKVKSWMEGIMQSTMNEFEKTRDGKYIIRAKGETFAAIFSKSGPACTLKMVSTQSKRKMDIDFVPCFHFTAAKWPKNGFRANPVPSKPNFFLVPKAPRDDRMNGIKARYWRMSFQEQERVLIGGKEKLKPTIRLLKKMRDTLQHNAIASYYIKTVALWMVDDRKNDSIWNSSSLSYIFMKMLKEYQKFLEQRKIPYFWYKKYNLVENGNPATLDNFSRRLKAIIDDVEKNSNEPKTIAKYLLNSIEYKRFEHEYDNLAETMSSLAIDANEDKKESSNCILS